MYRWLLALVVILGLGIGPYIQKGYANHVKGVDPCHQHYPNIKGTVLLEDDKVVIQRFTFPPGQWEGVHAHPPHQYYILLTDGDWTVRYGDRKITGGSKRGSVGAYGPVKLSEDHESVNSGDKPVDLIWVTLKQGCPEK